MCRSQHCADATWVVTGVGVPRHWRSVFVPLGCAVKVTAGALATGAVASVGASHISGNWNWCLIGGLQVRSPRIRSLCSVISKSRQVARSLDTVSRG